MRIVSKSPSGKRPSDARRVRRVHLASIEGLDGQASTDEQVAAWAHDRYPEEYPIESGTTHFVLAEVEGTVRGFGWMSPERPEYLQTEVDGEVAATYVHPSVAGNGVGSQLHSALEGNAVERDLDSLGLLASRNAVPFYETRGYERVTNHDHEYTDSVTLALVEMVKRSIR